MSSLTNVGSPTDDETYLYSQRRSRHCALREELNQVFLMVRTTLSFCVLFGFLIAGFAVLNQPSQEHSGTELKATSPSQAEPAERMAQRADDKVSFVSAPLMAEDMRVQLVSFDEDAKAEETPEEDAKPAPEKKETKPDASISDLEPFSEDKTEEKTEEPKPLEGVIEKKKELSPELIVLREKLRDALAHYYHQPENVALRSPWGAMHAMIAYGVDSELIAQNKKVNAIGYLCYNGNCNGQTLFWTQNGKLQTKIGPGVQGHAGQFLAMLAQSRVRTDYPMKVDGQDFHVADLIEHEKYTCQPRTELTFKLIALIHYLKSDDKWKSFDGQDWDIPRLIKEELAQPIVGAACGGTHRLTGFSYSIRKRQQRKEPMVGQWERAHKFIEDYHAYTFRLQNPDGSFSTNWFESRGDEGPPSRRLETTGHITEWLAFSLSEEELQDPKMIKAVDYLTNLLLDNRNEKWSIGPLGHGLHALAIYDERVFGGKPGQREAELARQVKPMVLRRK